MIKNSNEEYKNHINSIFLCKYTETSIDNISSEKKEKDNKKIIQDNIINNYLKYLTTYKTNTTSIRSIIKDQAVWETIDAAAKMVNRIVIHSYLFFKMFYKHCNIISTLIFIAINRIIKF